jgi:hypothetical protein
LNKLNSNINELVNINLDDEEEDKVNKDMIEKLINALKNKKKLLVIWN